MKHMRIASFFLALLMFSCGLLVSCGAEAGQYNDAMKLYEAGEFEDAKEAFEALKEYKDSKDWIKKCKNAILDQKYNDAVAKLDDGKIVEAYETLLALDGYKDSYDKLDSIASQYKAEKLKQAKVGDIVLFGRYEQDNVFNNGEEDIEWIVLEVTDGKAFLVSKYILDYESFNSTSPYAWNSSSIRTWCNETFYSSAFDANEQVKILATTLTMDKDAKKYGSVLEVGPVEDKVFLLNITELTKYWKNTKERIAMLTEYAKTKSVSSFANGSGEYWLRVSKSTTGVYYVNIGGDRSTERGRSVKGIRPAMWVDLNK